MSPISIAQRRSEVTKGSLRGEPEQQKEPSRHSRRNVEVFAERFGRAASLCSLGLTFYLGGGDLSKQTNVY